MEVFLTTESKKKSRLQKINFSNKDLLNLQLKGSKKNCCDWDFGY